MSHHEQNSVLKNSAADLAFVRALHDADGPADSAGIFPDALWKILQDARAPFWSLPRAFGGLGLSKPELVGANTRVAKGSLTAAFILSQYDAAVRRLLICSERPVATYWLEALSTGDAFATVGLSQLTTSRRLGAAALQAHEVGPGHYLLQGAMPWVTGAERADVLVAGAVTTDGQQLLFALPTDRPGVTIRPAYDLAALGSSRTSEVGCDLVELRDTDLLAGPLPDVMAGSSATGTGGLETSALAMGQALAALEAMESEPEATLAEPAAALRLEWNTLWHDLMNTACERKEAYPAPLIRGRANDLVLRMTQAYLTARKGSGFLKNDPAQRWARQALFFLVWSCPRPVAQAAIRDLAGLTCDASA
jgi:alkylation response protein AidB-like acyl-CoA dehydrogenase